MRFAFLLSIALGCAESHMGDGDAGASTEVASSRFLAIDGTSLYWIDGARGHVFRRARSGGDPVAIADASSYGPMAVTSTDIVWVSGGVHVMRVPIAGAVPVEIATARAGPIGVEADEEHVWCSPGSDLVELTLAGGAVRSLASVYALDVRLDGDDLFGTRCQPDGVWRVARAGGAPVLLGSDWFCPIAIAVDATGVYASDYAMPTDPTSGFAVFRVGREGGARQLIAPGSPLGFALHGGWVYTANGTRILRASTSDLHVEDLAAATSEVYGIAVDRDRVYWTESDASGVTLHEAPHG